MGQCGGGHIRLSCLDCFPLTEGPGPPSCPQKHGISERHSPYTAAPPLPHDGLEETGGDRVGHGRAEPVQAVGGTGRASRHLPCSGVSPSHQSCHPLALSARWPPPMLGRLLPAPPAHPPLSAQPVLAPVAGMLTGSGPGSPSRGRSCTRPPLSPALSRSSAAPRPPHPPPAPGGCP